MKVATWPLRILTTPAGRTQLTVTNLGTPGTRHGRIA